MNIHAPFYIRFTVLSLVLILSGISLAAQEHVDFGYYESDRNIKENFCPVDPDEILSKVMSLPVTEWNYIDDEDKVTHIGPMAQDFYEAFGLGGDDKSISTIDPAGVALVSIKALAKKQQELEALHGEVDALRRMVRELGLEMRALKESSRSNSDK